MTVAARTREAARADPFLVDALAAGVVNYSAAARFLDVDGETDAVVAALRRYAEELAHDEATTTAPVTMESGFGTGNPADALLAVGDMALVPGEGSLTALIARGDVGPAHLRRALGSLAAADIAIEAAGIADGTLVVAVQRRAGPDALRAVEAAIEA